MYETEEIIMHTGISKKTTDKGEVWCCQKCNYENERLYHAKMHFHRIHVMNGNPIPQKRKFHISNEMKTVKRPTLNDKDTKSTDSSTENITKYEEIKTVKRPTLNDKDTKGTDSSTENITKNEENVVQEKTCDFLKNEYREAQVMIFDDSKITRNIVELPNLTIEMKKDVNKGIRRYIIKKNCTMRMSDDKITADEIFQNANEILNNIREFPDSHIWNKE